MAVELISGNVSSAQGSTFSVLLPVSATSGSSQTIKVQTQQVVNGNVTVVSTATAANTLTTTSGVGIADMLPGAVYLTAANPEQIITLVNNGDATAQLQSFAASNPNIEVVFNPTSLASTGTTTATLKLKNSASSATSGAATLSYNNGKEQVTTAAVVEQNISPQPNPNPSPSPSPTSAPIPPAPTAGLTAVLSPNNNFFTTTNIGTANRQLTLTNTGNTTESNFVLTLPANFTISDGLSSSCTITQGTGPATISNNLTANGGYCTVSVIYTNSSKVDPAQSGAITVGYDYNNGTAATPVTAAVNYRVSQSTANLTITPNPVTFANVLNNGADYNQQTVIVTNSGDETATALGFSISGANSGLFSMIAGGTCTSGGVLSNDAGSNSCTIITQFGTFTSAVGAGSKTANLDVDYVPYSGAVATTATSVLNGQATAAQSASIAKGSETANGFAGGDGSNGTPYQIQQNTTPLPTISYTISNSGAGAATNFYIDGTATNWTLGGDCGTAGSKITLAATNGSCTLTMTLASTATIGAQNLSLSGLTMHWDDQANPSGQMQGLSGTSHVNVYAPASITTTTSPASNISIAPGESFTITATLSGGYNVAAQTIHAALTTGTTGDISFSNNDCALNSQNSYSCTVTVNTAGSAAAAAADVVTLSNTTTPAMTPNPAIVTFAIAQPIVQIALPQTGQLYCVPGTSFTQTCGSGYTSVAGTDGYGRSIPSYGDYIPYGVAWAYNGTGALNPATRFTAGTQADTTACPSGEEVRNDNLTGLMWVQNPTTTTYKWQDGATYPAQAAIDIMNTSGYCGYSDWRLPNINELASLVNQGASNTATWLKDPAQGFGANVQADTYWSSTTYANNAGYAWAVNTSGGAVGYGGDKSASRYVWPVRGTTALPAQIPQTGQTTSYATGDDGALQKGTVGTNASGRFVVGSSTEADCITDQQTGLMWVKDLNTVNSGGAASSWSNAISIASTGNWCGHSDWRLPNRNELRSLVNYGQRNVATWLNTQGFSNVQSYYWSSSTYAADTSNAWVVVVINGSVSATLKTDDYIYVWPVRGGQ